MADTKRITVLKTLEWLQNIQKDDSDAESDIGDIASDTDVYNLHEDNRNNSESESLPDSESLVSTFTQTSYL